MITKAQNPLLMKRSDICFDSTKLKTQYSVKSKVSTKKEIRRLMREETAQEAIGQLYSGCAIFGITKGQFSLIELIAVILSQTGPADVFISTWTAAGADLTDAFQLLESGKMTQCRFLVDHTFQRRKPAFAAKIRELFGIDAVRVTKNHAKFVLIRNDKWDIVLKTSMNLNTNPRLEDFDIQDDKVMADFLQGLMDEIFQKVKPKALYESAKLNTGYFHGNIS